eukprot:m.1093373 g.1093373  ORF g.1093373 m.1093373 type:complete len:968 (+) comp24297_c0_seq3:111-3014(+)
MITRHELVVIFVSVGCNIFQCNSVANTPNVASQFDKSGRRVSAANLLCHEAQCMAEHTTVHYSQKLGPRAYYLPPLGQVQPRGWLLEQLLLQANALSGYMATSTFPGAVNVNESLWVGGNYSTGTLQWLPYWTNGNVPLIELIRAAGATQRLDPGADLENVIEHYVSYILAHRNQTNGWIGPFLNEPGDTNGHGLWDPLNMLRTLLNYGQAHPERMREIAIASVAHMTKEAQLLSTDPVIKWAQTRWPTFVEIALYIVDELVPVFGTDPAVMPLGVQGTRGLLLNASALFQAKGMNWHDYYHRTGSVQFPTGPVQNWNTNDHGVNNAEGALRYPAVAYRMENNASYKHEMDFVLAMLDEYQGQVQSLFCADEVFCGREPHRGTETCAVVEAMASLEYAFTTLGQPALMDRVERLAFNAMPGALTADMWTHVYVQQANSVFAGVSHPPATDGARQADDGDASAACGRCGGTGLEAPHLRDTPSGEDQTANFYGVSHFPCCITNFPQGWPKFAMHTIVAEADASGVVIASLVPAFATVSSVGATVSVNSSYPFDDVATISVAVDGAVKGASITTGVRIPGWASRATVNGVSAPNGTIVKVPCPRGASTVIVVHLNTEARIETGWGGLGVVAGTAVNHTRDAAVVPSVANNIDLLLDGGASYLDGTQQPNTFGIRSGNPGQNTTAALNHPVCGDGFYIEQVSFSFQYVAGYTPPAGQHKVGSTLELIAFDTLTVQPIGEPLYVSPTLDKYSYDHYSGCSPVIPVKITGLRIPNARCVSFKLVFHNNERNLELSLPTAAGLGVTVTWSAARGPGVPLSPPHYLTAPENAVAVLYGPLVFALHPTERSVVTKTYTDDPPVRPKAVDYEISTNDTWNYALDLSTPVKVIKQSSPGWSPSMAFSTDEYPLYIQVAARQFPSWGFWEASNITAALPSSPVDCAAAHCGPKMTLRLVPFGGTNIRISAFPWFQEQH